MRARFNEQSLEGIRQQIAKAAHDSTKPRAAEEIGGLAVSLAHAEGYVFAWQTFEQAYNHPKGGRLEARDLLFDLLQQGADDSWSGRGNDVRRARFDGIRDAVRDLRWTPEFRGDDES